MRLRDMQKVVRQTVEEKRLEEAFRKEVSRVLGPVVVTEGVRLERVASAANDRIEVLERTGRANRFDFRSNIMAKFATHPSEEVRKLVARTLPPVMSARLSRDKAQTVRIAVAKRAPLQVVREMCDRERTNDQIHIIYENRLIAEDGIKQPKTDDEPFDMYGEDRLGDAVKQQDGPELSEVWYHNQAMRLIQDNGKFLEGNWEERAVRGLSIGMRSQGVIIDETKLLDKIKELEEERDDMHLERDALKETVARLRGLDVIVESVEEEDPVRSLVESRLSPQEYIDEANGLFGIRESTVPPAVRKHRSTVRSESVPVVGSLPHSRGFRSIDEQALDTYVKHWNDRQAFSGEPLKLAWSTHPDAVGKISFNVILR